jgi:hypothetical protein
MGGRKAPQPSPNETKGITDKPQSVVTKPTPPPPPPPPPKR